MSARMALDETVPLALQERSPWGSPWGGLAACELGPASSSKSARKSVSIWGLEVGAGLETSEDFNRFRGGVQRSTGADADMV